MKGGEFGFILPNKLQFIVSKDLFQLSIKTMSEFGDSQAS